MKEGLILGLCAGMIVGAVVVAQCKETRDMVKRTTDAVVDKAKQTAKQIDKKSKNMKKTQE